MTSPKSRARERAEKYAKSKKLTIHEEFGDGCDGFVMSTNSKTAIKAFNFKKLYDQELEIYEYLKKWEIFEVKGFQIPRLIASDANLWIIEMTVVSPPFVLDFVSARIEIPIDTMISGLRPEWKNLKMIGQS